MLPKIKIFSIIIFSLLLVIPVFLHAEIDIQSTDIVVTVFPINPRPYTDTTITLSSYATDLNKAMIKWKIGSKTILSGYGKTKYSFKTSGPNQPTSLIVTISPSDSIGEINKNISIVPSEVEILWQAEDGYTPPFYKGKSFVSKEGKIKVVAMPNMSGSNTDKKSMTYSWKLGDDNKQGESGYAKDSYVFENSKLNNEEEVSVTISSLSGNYNGTGSITIPIVNPKIIFYKKSPTEGVLYSNALGNDFNMTEEEMTIVAEPYFLALKGNENAFDYLWKINGEKIETPSKKTELTVRPSSKGGYATISLIMENFNTLFQKVTGNLKINL
jgi:hypothetical protein